MIKNIVFSNLLVALCASFLFSTSCLFFDLKILKELVLIVFCSTFSFYNLISLKSVNNMIDERKKWILNYYNFIKMSTLLTTIFSIFLIIKLNLFTLLSPVIFISLLYNYPIIKLLNFEKIQFFFLKKNLREIPFLKAFIIVFCWTYLTYLFPIFYNDLNFDISIIIHLIIRVLFLFSIAINFDIRDREIDLILTIPTFLGEKNSKILSCSLLLICELLALYLFILHYLDFLSFLALYLTFEIGLILTYFINKNSKELYFSFYIESLSILMFILVYIASIIFYV